MFATDTNATEASATAIPAFGMANSSANGAVILAASPSSSVSIPLRALRVAFAAHCHRHRGSHNRQHRARRKQIIGTPNSVQGAEICKGPRFNTGALLDQGGGYWPPTSTFDSIDPALTGSFQVTLKDGSTHTVRPVWSYLLGSVKECTCEWAANITGVNAQLIREACLAWATRPEGQRWGNDGIRFQLTTDQVGDVVQRIRTLLHLCHLTGNFDTPAGNRGPTRAPSLGLEGAGPRGPYWEVTDMTNGCPITTSERWRNAPCPITRS